MDLRELPVPIMTRYYLQKPNVKIEYPQVYGLKDDMIEWKINNKIISTINHLNETQGYFQKSKIEIDGTYELKTNERGVLSLSLINYAYTGGAHGITFMKSLNFDVKTGNDFVLKDLFKKNSHYEERLSKIIKKQLNDRNIQTINEFGGIHANQDYYLADKALVLYFQLYDITPYEFGFPFFPISVYELEDIIDQNGILSCMLT